MEDPTTKENTPTTTQQRVMTSGPPAYIPSQKVVIAPASTEMMEKLMAKFENVPSFRRSSWA